MNFHVRELGLAAPGTDEQLAEQVARIVSRPLDRGRPLWELYLISGLRSGDVAMLTKIHHAVIDGMSGAEIMGLLLDLTPEIRTIEAEGPWATTRPSPVSSGCSLAASPAPRGTRCARSARCPRHSRISRRRSSRSSPASPRSGGSRRAQYAIARQDGGVERTSLDAPKTSFNGRVSPHRRFTFGQLSLDDVKAVK
ncbi:MAG TPA: wax ester/triacylglycerol synthase domain-containing protein, partial [Solirubrobacteraceae bacterium]|nr:wax ester/triacylglycerol synthase domain-containing protein [Solirubrobacteraceae bacterium]